ncbi:MAG: SET domain-containing protein [Deltaproteobacteria bacterium]|nr:SET domain-containing protein [Deltaproteobacteria bacterium]
MRGSTGSFAGKFGPSVIRDAHVTLRGRFPIATSQEVIPVLVQAVDERRGSGLISQKKRAVGDVLASVEANSLIMEAPDKHSVQLGFDRHLDTTDLCMAHLNHSCSPNTKITFEEGVVTMHAIRDIAVGDELSFNYLTTEYDLECPFECSCQSTDCYGKIQGYLHLKTMQRQDLQPFALPYLREFGSLCDSDQ